MNALQIFAFIAMPIAIAIIGWILAFLVAPPHSSRAENASLAKSRRSHA